MRRNRIVSPHVKIPRGLFPKPLNVRAVTRFYRLLDSGAIRNRDASYGGQVAASTVAKEFNVPREVIWRWIREHAAQNAQQNAQQNDPQNTRQSA